VRNLKWILFALGIGLLALLVTRIGVGAIEAAFERLSWRLVIVVGFPFVLVNVFDTLGWRFALPARRVPFVTLFMARLTGEAFNATTPTASLGGETVKAALVRSHVDYREGALSVIVAKTTLTVSQVLFLGACLPLIPRHLGADPRLGSALSWAFGLEALAVGGFVAAQVLGLAASVLRRLPWLAGARVMRMAGILDDGLREFYRRHLVRVVASTACHFLGWLISGVEAYVILQLLGVPASLQTALLVEACGTAIRFASFMIPAHIGALEGGVVATFVALGLDAGDGLSFTLVRRVRELVWVAIGFLVLAARPVDRLRDSAWLSERA
jgi:hypothetical protein